MSTIDTDKPTITDEDRAAARAIWIEAAYEYGGQSIPGEGEERATRVVADFIADTYQAAFNAGLERAVKSVQVELAMCAIANDEAPSEWIDGFEFAWKRANAAIRAEKEKPQ